MSVDPTFLRLSRGWGHMRAGNATDLWSLTTGKRFRITGAPAAVHRLLVRLRNGFDVRQGLTALAEEAGLPPAQTEMVVERLQREGAILSAPALAAAPEGASRSLYDPQVEFFHMFERETADGRVIDHRLRHRRVVIVGVGGYGSFIAQLVARIGIRHIAAVDMDRVELSNLSRQVLYSRDDIGLLKVEAAAPRVLESDPEIIYEPHPIRVRSADDLLPIVRDADLVFSPFGYIRSDIRDSIMRACLVTGAPLLTLGMTTFGPLWVPGRTACSECLLHQQQSHFAETLRSVQESGWMPPRGPFAPPIALMCSFAVWEAARFLSGCDEPRTLNGMCVFDPIKYTLSFWHGERSSRCAFCGDAAAETSIGSPAPGQHVG